MYMVFIIDYTDHLMNEFKMLILLIIVTERCASF